MIYPWVDRDEEGRLFYGIRGSFSWERLGQLISSLLKPFRRTIKKKTMTKPVDETVAIGSLQIALSCMGHNPGEIDGKMGKLTKDALKALSEELGIGVGAIADLEPSESMFAINSDGVDLVKYFESGGDFSDGGDKRYLTAYLDAVGVWTIGYGHTGKSHNDGTVKRGRVITEQEADILLIADLNYFANKVREMVAVPVTVDQFAAMVAFAFNLGETNLRSSTLMRCLNAKKYNEAAEQFDRWVYAGKTKLEGLVRRRAAEKLLFQGDDWKSFDRKP